MSSAVGPVIAVANPLAGLVTHPYAYPLLESAHILGIALLVGSLALVEMRVWLRQAEPPAAVLGRLALPVTLAGFGLAAATGLLMFMAQPQDLLANRAFLLKLTLVTLAGLNAVSFHARGGLAQADGVARAQTAVSAGLWIGAIIAGRFIGYV
jgi:hypothetical protein